MCVVVPVVISFVQSLGSEATPAVDQSVCFYDTQEGRMIGSMNASDSLKKLRSGDRVELLLNADLGTLQFSVNDCVEVWFEQYCDV